MPIVTIIIVSWNVREHLAECLESVKHEINRIQASEVQTILVDNNSTDGTVEMVRGEFDWVELVESKRNLGFAGGNNLALENASGEYILLLNPDVVLKQGALAGLIQFMEAVPGAAGVGPRLISPNGSLQQSTYPAPTLGREFWRLLKLDYLSRRSIYPLERWRNGGPRQVDVVQGACLLLRGVALRDVGNLDEGFFMYSEEVDLCLRLRMAGWDIYWLPSLDVIHYGGQSTRLVARQMFLHLYRSKSHYFHKHYGFPSLLGYKLILLLASTIRVLLSPLALLEAEPKRSQHLSLAVNYARLLLDLPKF